MKKSLITSLMWVTQDLARKEKQSKKMLDSESELTYERSKSWVKELIVDILDTELKERNITPNEMMNMINHSLEWVMRLEQYDFDLLDELLEDWDLEEVKNLLLEKGLEWVSDNSTYILFSFQKHNRTQEEFEETLWFIS